MRSAYAVIMGVNNKLCQLDSLLDEWDRESVTVRSVTVSDEAGSADSTTAEIELETPLTNDTESNETVVECTPSTTANGTLGVTVETDLPIPESELVREVEPADATLTPAGAAEVTVTLTLSDGDSASGAADARSASGGEQRASTDAPERQESTTGRTTRDYAPFKDPELLQEVYDTHDTFAEMAEALEMDVTGETVRRYMIDYDIHQPKSYQTESTESLGSDEEMLVLSDGVGLPDNVEVEELIETVNESNTIYEVKEDLDLERKEAHEILKKLNLVDLVMGRLSNDRNRDITREDVIDRLRETSHARAT